MRDETLNKIREEYDSKKTNKIRKMEQSKKIYELQQDKKVLEYMKLRRLKPLRVPVYDNTFDTSKLLDSIFLNYIPLIDHNETNNIYVYITEYITNNYGKEELEYCFANIEQKYYTTIRSNHLEEFLDQNTIIYPENDTESLLEADDLLIKVRTEFITKAVETSQEEAKRYIKEKYNSNIKSR